MRPDKTLVYIIYVNKEIYVLMKVLLSNQKNKTRSIITPHHQNSSTHTRRRISKKGVGGRSLVILKLSYAGKRLAARISDIVSDGKPTYHCLLNFHSRTHRCASRGRINHRFCEKARAGSPGGKESKLTAVPG